MLERGLGKKREGRNETQDMTHVRLGQIGSLVHSCICNLKHHMNDWLKSAFNDDEAAKCLFSLDEKFFVVIVDKAANNIVFVCKAQ